jgi:hypothetical protein
VKLGVKVAEILKDDEASEVSRLRKTCPIMAFDDAGEVIGMEHHTATDWPALVIVASFLLEGNNGQPYEPFAISGADHGYDVGAQKVRALSDDQANATFDPGLPGTGAMRTLRRMTGTKRRGQPRYCGA